jgi:para-nitrobenzyl esterase
MKTRSAASAAALVLVLISSNGWAQAVPAPVDAKAAAASATAAPPATAPVIKTEQGKVQGLIVNDVVVFRGLPFAAPPVGDLRWRAPKPAAKWSEVKVAETFGANCAQAEDCLYLNVYQPLDAKPNAKLPVMVWIHGGAFIFGSGSGYDGTQFAKQGVIVVTINYRLGRAGWFAHPALTQETPKGPLGNYGLLDQIAALQWVEDNIAKFGGDKDNVTAFGESAGAISINFLMLAPQARGLFDKAIAQSGFGRLAPLPLRTDEASPQSGEQIGVRFAEKVGIKGSNAAAAKALRALSFKDLNAAQGGVGSPDASLPLADGKYITGSALAGFAKGAQAPVPYLVGGNSDEASLTRRAMNAPEQLAAIKEGREAFLAAFDPDNTSNAERIMARLVTDLTISEPDRALARLHAQRSPTYVYHFSYTPLAQRDTAFGLAHGGELSYVFNSPRGGGSFDEEGKKIAQAANQYWAEFAKTGNPGSAGGPAWPKFDMADEALLEFAAGGVPIVHQHFHAQRLDIAQQLNARQP